MPSDSPSDAEIARLALKWGRARARTRKTPRDHSFPGIPQSEVNASYAFHQLVAAVEARLGTPLRTL